jgi:hypothetical protein
MVSFDEVAEWAGSLRAERVPDPVRKAAARERDSVRAAVAAAWRTRSGRYWERVTSPGHERDAGLSVLLDYDDYGFLGHPGHSAAVVAGGHEEAHLAAAELALRLGAACLLAPSNGQGWTFIHGPAAALAAGLRAGHDQKTLARAMGLAFLAPCSPTWGALLATQAKPARIAGPVSTGLRGAALAAEGVAPPRRALADGLAAASFAPLPSLLGGLGERWLLSTLCFKPRPGCAYLQAALAAFAELGPLEGDSVAGIEVEAGAATLTMEALTRREDVPADEPVATQFSVERSLRVALAYGDVNPQTLEQPLPLGPEVRLRHEPNFTRDTVASIERAVPLSRAALRELDLVDWLSVFVGTWKSYGRTLRMSPRALGALRLRNTDWRLSDLELVFPARVTVRLRNGEELVAERRRHPGQAGDSEEELDAIIAAKGAAYTQAA